MPIKRRLAKGITHRITPEAVAAFGAGDQMALHRALGLAPWQVSPLDADTPAPPAWASHRTAWAESWPVAHDLRQALTEAA
ncbi:MAG: hypothetical protein COW54_05975 [Rhodobacteraceae bacterium CG17_big_fil_post_rev_8_21_14_2_50_63_15]|nr:hypothetical protein [Roseovarius sp.]PIV79084.1 MAG: hypothetical protein COW54_05975 [Rhodobacteraceae bacterium CG17_big_fil_post_rev_8_21_14_2_50_63_15]